MPQGKTKYDERWRTGRKKQLSDGEGFQGDTVGSPLSWARDEDEDA